MNKKILFSKTTEAKRLLIEIQDILMSENAPIKQIERIETIIWKIESFQSRYLK